MSLIGKSEKFLEFIIPAAGDAPCGRCGSDLMFYSKQYYFNLVILPMWPMGKTLTAKCSNCGAQYAEEQFSPRVIENVKKKRRKRTSIGMFSGSIVFFVVLPLVLLGWQKSKEERQQRVANPQEGNVYLVKDKKERGFVYFKLMGFRNDSLWLSPHSAWFPEEESAAEHHGKYSEDTTEWMLISRQDLKDWDKSGKLREINKW